MGYTVKQLLEACQEEVNNGNGDKVVLISDDDEGNGFHTLFYQFASNTESIKAYSDMGMFHDNNDPNGVILLG